MYIDLKKNSIYYTFYYFSLVFYNRKYLFLYNYFPINNTNNSIIPGYLGCFIDYRTSNCDDCPPSCLSNNSSNIIIENKKLARHRLGF